MNSALSDMERLLALVTQAPTSNQAISASVRPKYVHRAADREGSAWFGNSKKHDRAVLVCDENPAVPALPANHFCLLGNTARAFCVPSGHNPLRPLQRSRSTVAFWYIKGHTEAAV